MPAKPEIADASRSMDERSWWDLWNTSYRTKDNNDAVSGELFARAATIINGITRAADCRMLEIACGTGTLSRMVTYASYTGLDISPAAIEIARQKGTGASGTAPRSYEAADFHEWPLPEQKFDVAVCIDAISSIRDQPVAMRKIADSLRSKGWLVLTTINRFVYDRIQRTAPTSLQSGPVAKWLTRGELLDLVRQGGFRIEHSETIMPRGNLGILRWVNSYRLNESFGPSVSAVLRRLKERCGLGQYTVVVARKAG